jgi:hypothetical protein
MDEKLVLLLDMVRTMLEVTATFAGPEMTVNKFERNGEGNRCGIDLNCGCSEVSRSSP